MKSAQNTTESPRFKIHIRQQHSEVVEAMFRDC